MIALRILAPRIDSKQKFVELLFPEAEHLFRKAIVAIHRALPDDYENQFSEQDTINFLIITAIFGALCFAGYLDWRDKKSSGTNNES